MHDEANMAGAITHRGFSMCDCDLGNADFASTETHTSSVRVFIGRRFGGNCNIGSGGFRPSARRVSVRFVGEGVGRKFVEMVVDFSCGASFEQPTLVVGRVPGDEHGELGFLRRPLFGGAWCE